MEEVPEHPGFLKMCCLLCGRSKKLPSSTGAADDEKKPCGLLCLVEHSYFAGLIQVLIFLSSVLLIIDLPGSLAAEAAEAARPFIMATEYIFTFIFTIEMALKLGAYGALGYFQNSWNVLDFVVVCISWPSLLLPGAEQGCYQATPGESCATSTGASSLPARITRPVSTR